MYKLCQWIWAAGLLLLVGCGGSASATPSTAKAVLPAAPTATTAKKEPAAAPDVAPAPNADASEFEDDAQLPQRESSQLFMPPPQRVEPTAPAPKPAVVVAAPSARTMEVAAVPEVNLLGFVDVDGLQALLSIEGQPCLCDVGPLDHGLEMVRIEPPQVHLRFGEQNLQLSLFEQPLRNHPPGAVVSMPVPRATVAPTHRTELASGRDPWSPPRARETNTPQQVEPEKTEASSPVPIPQPPAPPTPVPLPGPSLLPVAKPQ